MAQQVALYEPNLPGLKLLARGKVRHMYDLGDYLLIVTTDRISAFDVVLSNPIPGKGEVLTRITNFWLDYLKDIVPNQSTNLKLKDLVTIDANALSILGDRVAIVRKLKPLPVEAIVRGYVIGSGWKDYQNTGSICGIELPEGLQQAEKLPEAIYTPSTKAQQGSHDENIPYEKTVELLGPELAEQVRDVALQLYTKAADYALERGIIIADTKFEFGLDSNGKLHLIDEVLTPDSSRFWPKETYKVGVSPLSLDKQIVRDYLETLDWNKKSPGPELPHEITAKTAAGYPEVERILTGT